MGGSPVEVEMFLFSICGSIDFLGRLNGAFEWGSARKVSVG